MLPRGLVRLKAFVLVVVLLNGGGGLPLLDFALYHRHNSQSARDSITTAYVGDAEAQPVHRQICRLSWTLPHSSETRAIDRGLPLFAPTLRQPTLVPVAVPRPVEPDASLRTRSPPTFLT
jgi:hypothetical protein